MKNSYPLKNHSQIAILIPSNIKFNDFGSVLKVHSGELRFYLSNHTGSCTNTLFYEQKKICPTSILFTSKRRQK